METLPNVFIIIVSACVSQAPIEDSTQVSCREFMVRPQFETKPQCESNLLPAVEFFAEMAIKRGYNFTIQDVECRKYLAEGN